MKENGLVSPAGGRLTGEDGGNPPTGAPSSGTPAAGSFVLVWSSAVFLALLWGVLAASLRLTHGNLAYALDDTYVHMAMARHFAQDGVWGVTPFEFSNSSSAPLWTLLLAGVFKLFGARSILPFLLNVLTAMLAIFLFGRIVWRRLPEATRATHLALSLALILFTPLVPLVFTGQEHTLQLALTLLFADCAARLTGGEAPTGGETPTGRFGRWLLPATALLLPMVRYESLFLILSFCLLAWRGHRRTALAVGALALAGPLLYGLVSVSHGWHLVPNTLLIKAHLPRGHAGRWVLLLTGLTALRMLVENPHLLVLAASALLLLSLPEARERGLRRSDRHLLLLFLGALLLHLSLADTGWFYRYEAYLVALGVLAVGIGFVALLRPALPPGAPAPRPLRAFAGVAVMSCLLITTAALARRGVTAALETPRATANIYQQQVQIGLFLREYYEGATVALNDIGAADFFADIHCLDLAGLADRQADTSVSVGGLYVAGINDEAIRRQGARLAVLYPSWFRIPPGWVPCGTWTMKDNVVNGDTRVAFFALDGAEVDPLTAHLREFSRRMPAEVEQSVRQNPGH